MTDVPVPVRLRVGARVSLAVAAVSIAVAVAAVVVASRDASEFDPFGEFPVQLIANADRNADGLPVVSISRDRFVVIEGQKCYDEAVEVVGATRYQPLDPAGVAATFTEGSATRLAGCAFWLADPTQCPPTASECFQAFRNDLAPLMGRVVELAEQGLEQRLKISGDETPVDGGVTQPFSSEEFILIP